MYTNSPRGFTLIELILVIVLIGILSVVATVFILPPFQAAADIERRATLVDAADLAVNRITREVRNALPNSLRVSANQIEFISTVTSGRYRRLPAPGGGSDIFVPGRSNGSFDVLGGLIDSGAITPRGAGIDCGTPQAAACRSTTPASPVLMRGRAEHRRHHRRRRRLDHLRQRRQRPALCHALTAATLPCHRRNRALPLQRRPTAPLRRLRRGRRPQAAPATWSPTTSPTASSATTRAPRPAGAF